MYNLQEVFGSILAMGDAAVCSVTNNNEGRVRVVNTLVIISPPVSPRLTPLSPHPTPSVPNKSGPLPQTAQVAAQQGAYVARLFNRRYRLGQLPAPSVPKSAKEMENEYNESRNAPGRYRMIYCLTTAVVVAVDCCCYCC